MREAILLSIIMFCSGLFIGHKLNEPKNISHKLEKVDEKYYEIFENARSQNDYIASAISNGTISLRISSDSAKTASLDDGQRAKCNIHKSDAQRIIAITKRADECSARLSGLQSWVEEHLKR